MSNPFNIKMYIITESRLKQIITKAHVNGFLDGLDNNCYRDLMSPGYETTALAYADFAVENARENMLEFGNSEDDEEESPWGTIP